LRRLDGAKCAVAFLRTASGFQSDASVSIARHEQRCQHTASTLDARIRRLYVDPGVLGSCRERPALGMMLADLAHESCDYVVLADRAGLARNRRLAQELADRIRECGALLVDANSTTNN
jgi:DNA invertase Pin-like site-specific DNA recombinase